MLQQILTTVISATETAKPLWKEVAVISAGVSAVVSVIGVLVSTQWKFVLDKWFLNFKLDAEYRYEQKKQLCELIGRYHGRMRRAAINFKHLIWNLYQNANEGCVTRNWL